MLGAGRHQTEGPAAAAVVAEIEPPLSVGEDPGRGIEDRVSGALLPTVTIDVIDQWLAIKRDHPVPDLLPAVSE